MACLPTEFCLLQILVLMIYGFQYIGLLPLGENNS